MEKKKMLHKRPVGRKEQDGFFQHNLRRNAWQFI